MINTQTKISNFFYKKVNTINNLIYKLLSVFRNFEAL
jgi:hypothetical protein